MHPNVAVRLALASEPSVSESQLRQLATDLDAMVSYAARWQLKHRLPPIDRSGSWSTQPEPTAGPVDSRDDDDWEEEG